MENLKHVRILINDLPYYEGRFEIVMIGSWSMFKLTDRKGTVRYFNPLHVVYIEPLDKE